MMTNLQRRFGFARIRRWAWSCAICLSSAGAPSWAQDAPGTTGPAALREAYQASQLATSEADFTRVIRACERGLAESTGVHAEYARNLMSWALNKRGEVRAESRKEEEALADFVAAVQLDATRWRAIHNRGVSYAMLGRYDEAMADFDETLKLEPKYPNAWFNRGEIRYQRGDFAAAIGDYNEALKLKPDDPVTLNSRGHAYYRQGNYQAAILDYTQAIRLNPKSAAAYINRADTYADRGQFTEAARDYRTAIRTDPQMGRAYQSAAWLLATCPDARFRDPELAVKSAKKAIELDGDDDYRYLDTLAAAYASAGQFSLARDTEAKAIELAPKEPAEVISRFRQRLRLYEQDQPYVHARQRAATATATDAPSPAAGRGTDTERQASSQDGD